jgi:hypothetical protein
MPDSATAIVSAIVPWNESITCCTASRGAMPPWISFTSSAKASRSSSSRPATVAFSSASSCSGVTLRHLGTEPRQFRRVVADRLHVVRVAP